MNLRDGMRLALLQIRTEKLKSFFGLLGVVVGVAFLVVVVTVVEGLDRYIEEDFSARIFGIHTVTLRPVPTVQFAADPETRRRWARRPSLTRDDAEALREGMRLPVRLAVESSSHGTVRADHGRTVENVLISGASPAIFEIRNLAVVAGRPFSEAEEAQGLPVIVLGSSTAETLYPDRDPLGRTVRVGGTPYRVVGVLEAQGSVLGVSLDNRAIGPSRSPLRRVVAGRDEVDQIVIQTPDAALFDTALREAEGIVRARHRLRPGEANDFEVETAEASLEFWSRISTVLFLALPGLVGISLVVGGIVIMNIMLVSVIERTREIGTRKAVGARRRDVLVQVLIESATLSGTGALVGIGLGWGLAAAIRAVSPLPVAVRPVWLVLALAVGLGVGLVSGAYPASRAARLDPIEALGRA